MRKGVAVAWCVAALASAAPRAVAPIGGGNALTLPAHRHVVRIETGNGRAPTLLLAVQQQSAGARGLQLYRSDDRVGVGRTWKRLGAIQPDASHTDRAELIVVGKDLALVYAYEGPKLGGSTRHDVYFQWWRYRSGAHTWVPQKPVRVFDSTSGGTAYSRAELARDSRGRIWIQAFRLDPGGGSTAVLAVSENGGRTFRHLPSLGYTRRRGGGRLIHTGHQLVFLWAMHDGFEPTRMRIHRDGDLPEKWSAQQNAFPDGIYHGAALSAVEDGAGGLHLVYKDEAERLYYRRFNGRSWSHRILVDGRRDWALQPAITRVGSTVYIFFTAPKGGGKYELDYRILSGGKLGSLKRLATTPTFKGYPAALATLPPRASEVPVFWGDTPGVSRSGTLMRAAVSRSPGGHTKVAEAVQEGSGDEAVTLEDEHVLFEERLEAGGRLGEHWTTRHEGGAEVAVAEAAACDACEVEADVRTADDVAVAIRAGQEGRYTAVLRADGRVEVRRETGATFVVLGSAPSGLTDLSAGATLSLSATGAAPVELIVRVNGTPRLSATDTSPHALTDGAPGLVRTSPDAAVGAFRVRAAP